MVFLAHICNNNKNLAPEKKGLAPELFLVLSTLALGYEKYFLRTPCNRYARVVPQILVALR
jgi:hypothetical protein